MLNVETEQRIDNLAEKLTNLRGYL